MAGVKNNKLKASSLVETLIATVVIMVVFGIAIATISNVLERTVKSSTSAIDSELNKLVYLYEHDQIQVPDVRELKEWRIELKKVKGEEVNYIVFVAKHVKNQKVRERKIVEKES